MSRAGGIADRRAGSLVAVTLGVFLAACTPAAGDASRVTPSPSPTLALPSLAQPPDTRERLLELVTGEWCMREYDRSWPSPVELDALIEQAGGVERWIKADDLWAGSLEALAASVNGEVVGVWGTSTFVFLDPGDGFPYALGMLGVTSAAGHPVWVVMARLHDCADPKRGP